MNSILFRMLYQYDFIHMYICASSVDKFCYRYTVSYSTTIDIFASPVQTSIPRPEVVLAEKTSETARIRPSRELYGYPPPPPDTQYIFIVTLLAMFS